MKKLLLFLFVINLSLNTWATDFTINGVNALQFDGANNYVAIPSVATNLSTFTIEAWVRPNAVPASGFVAILNTTSWDATNGSSIHFQVENSNLMLAVYGITGGFPYSGYTPTTCWQHLAVTYDKPNSLVKFYVNGTLVQSVSRSLPLAKIDAASIGSWKGTERYFNGTIDEVRVWNTVRTAADITGNMMTPLVNPESISGLIAYYPFDQGVAGEGNATQTTLLDKSANHLNGTLKNFWLGNYSNWCERTTSDNALHFDGTDDYVDLSTSLPVDYSKGFSCTAMVKWDKFNSWSRIIDFGNGSASDNILFANSSTSGTPYFAVYKGGGETHISATKSLNANQWYNLAVTVSAAGVAKLYIDGALNNTVTGVSLPNTIARTKQYIGKSNWASESYFSGMMDNIGVWNRELTATEAAAGATNLTGNEAGLVYSYKFNQGSAGGSNSNITTLIDGSSSAQNGTLKNFALSALQSNFVKNFQTPVISSISPLLGAVSSAVTINGSNFNAIPANNIVYMGAVRANVTAATPTSVTATVPAGATFQLLSLMDATTGLTAYSPQPFLQTFAGTPTISMEDTKTFATGTTPASVAICDIDGDGKPDMVTTNRDNNTISVLLSTCTVGNIGFAAKIDIGVAQNPNMVIAGDIDGDGKLDLITANVGSNSISVLRNTSTVGAVSFAASVDYTVGTNPFNLAIGDLDGDGKPDIVVANTFSSSLSVFRNTSSAGNVALAPKIDIVVGERPLGLAIGDIDGDGKADIVEVEIFGCKVAVLRNTGSWGSISFAPKVDYPLGGNPRNVALSDFDGDGRLDMAVTVQSDMAVSVFRNTSTVSNVSFDAKINLPSINNLDAISIADFNGDGKPDIVTSSLPEYFACVYPNSSTMGSLSFATRVDFGSPYAQSVQAGDIDGDGKPDIIVTNCKSATHNVGVFRNITTNGVLNISAATVSMRANATTRAVDVTCNTPWAVYSHDSWLDVNATGLTGNGRITLTASSNFTGITRTAIVTIKSGILTRTITVLQVSSAVPTITSTSSVNGTAGAAITITGSNFNTTPSNNIVFFGATRATVTAATATSLTVTIPAGATYRNLSVTDIVTGLTGYSTLPFNPTYNNTSAVLFDPKVDFASAEIPSFSVIHDLNGDGKPDLVAVNLAANTVSVLSNASSAGSLAFAPKADFATGSLPFHVAVGDLDGDGLPDLAITNRSSNTVSVLRNTSTSGNISFAPKVDFATGTSPYYVAIGDIDGDGRLDLAIANNQSGSVSVIINSGSAGNISFEPKIDYTVGTSPTSVAIANLDDDGKPDLAVTNYTSNTVSILKNTSTSSVSFADKIDIAVSSNPLSICAGDFDGDGKADLATVNYGSYTVSVLRNTSSGGAIGFADKADYFTGDNPKSVTVGDIDGNGKPDLIVANLASENISLLRNTSTTGAISFADRDDYAIGSGVTNASMADLDGDGNPDFAIASASTKNISVLRFTTKPTVNLSSLVARVGWEANSTATIKVAANIGCSASSNQPWLTVSPASLTGNGTFTFTATINVGINKREALVTVSASGLTNQVIKVTQSGGNPPIITSLSPASGGVGTVVTINGSSFSSVPAENIVYFGAVRATVSAATATSLTVAVPAGAGSVVPVTVVINGGIGYSTTSSPPRFTITSTPNPALTYKRTDIPVGEEADDVAVGDFNGDGKADIAVSNYYSHTVSILEGNGDGTVKGKVDVGVGSFPLALAVGDVNADGKLDLVSTCYNSPVVSVLLGHGDGTFENKVDFGVGNSPNAIAIADFNGDGKADLAVSNYDNNNISILLGNGNGTFAPRVNYATGRIPQALVVGDFNGDHKVDFAVTSGQTNMVCIHLGRGDGTFAAKVDYPVATDPMALAVGDFNGDGILDLATANSSSNSVSLLEGNGNGTFAPRVDYPMGDGSSPNSLAVGDFNGDGFADLAVTNRNWNGVGLLQGVGNGTFVRGIDIAVGSNPYDIAFGDFNGDGLADMVTANDASNDATILVNSSVVVATKGVADIGSTTATVNATIASIGFLPIVQHGVVWSKATKPEVNLTTKTEKGFITGLGFTSSIADLEPRTKYYVRAYVTNLDGTSYGNELSFTTLSVPDAPTGVTATCANSKTTVTFTVPVFDGGTPITNYKVTASPGGKTATGSTSPIDITGLTIGNTYTFTATATNAIGESLPSMVSVPLTITDTEKPSIAGVPANISVNTDAGQSYATVSWTAPTAADNVAVTSFTTDHAIGSQFPVGVTTVTYTAKDAAGNTTTATFTVTVTDNEKPVITGIPANITVNIDADKSYATVTWTAPTAADNVAVTTFTTDHAIGSQFPIGTTTVTYTAKDAAANTTTASFTVTVADNEKPALSSTPSNITVNTDAGMSYAAVIWTEPVATDNVGVLTFTSNHANGSQFPVGTTAVTYTATDAAGNSDKTSFTITVVDAEKPVITSIPSDINVSTDAGKDYATVTVGAATATDNVGVISLIATPRPAAFPVGSTIITYTAMDAAGNIATRSFTVTVTQAAGAATLSVSAPMVYAGAEGGNTPSVEIFSNTTWNVASDQSWLTINAATGTGNGMLTFAVEANLMQTPRTATVTISAPGATSKIITVSQAPGSATLNLSATTASIAASVGSTATVDVTSNTSWTATSDQSWLTVSPASATGNGTLTFTAAVNTTTGTRTATVTVSGTGVASQTITITQAAAATYVITASINPANSGAVTGAGSYNPGDNVTLTATPNTGYSFVNWTENGAEIVSNDASYSFTASASRTLIANFHAVVVPATYVITASVSLANSGTVTGIGSYNSGDNVTLTATPNTGYSFVNWTENGAEVSTTTSYSFTASASRTLVANFHAVVVPATYVITASVSLANSGIVTGIGSYNSGDNVTLTATPNTGYSFVNWTENSAEVSTTASYSFTASASRTLIANFHAVVVPATYVITASVSLANSGTVTGIGSYNSGDNVTLTATSNTGYSFVNWTENGAEVSTTTSYSFTASASRTLVANFKVDVVQYSIAASASPASSGTVTGAGSYNSGDNVTLTATPNTGYSFVNWTENGAEVSTTASYSFTASTSRTLVANFKLIATGIDEVTGTNSISIYPNPTTDHFAVKGLDKAATLQLFDISGKLLLTKEVSDASPVSVSSLVRGMYIVKVAGRKFRLIKK